MAISDYRAVGICIVGAGAHDGPKPSPLGKVDSKMSQKDIFEDGRGYNLSHRKRSPVNQSMIAPGNHRDFYSLRYPKGEGICVIATAR